MKITGELLKSERIKLKLSQQDIAFALKLSPRIINAIEEGDVDSLPAKTFVRGFVKSYAEMLKLDSTMVLNQFHEEMGTGQPTSKLISTPSENAKAKASNYNETSKTAPISSVTPNLKTSLNRNTLKITALITLAVIIIGGINQVINKYQKEGSNTEPQKLSVETLNQEARVPQEKLSVPTEASVTETPPTPTAPVEVKAEPKPEVAKAEPKPEPKLEAKPETPGKSIELIIEANKDTTLSYATGINSDFRTLNLKKDAIQILKSKTGLHLKIDEGNAVSITVNGINKGLASSDEKPIELSY